MNPSEFMAKIRREHATAQVAKQAEHDRIHREIAAETAERERKEAAREAAEQILHIHPSDDPWTKTCRTICGKVVPVRQAIAPRAVSRFSVFDLAGCHECWAVWSAWRLSGNGKPLTYRRLGLWPGKSYDTEVTMDEKTKSEVKTNARVKAISRALEVRRREVTRPEEDGIYIFLGELLMAEHQAIARAAPPANYKAGGETHNARVMVKSLTVELIRMKPSPAVMRALQGV